ncbi:MAG: peptide ABC transporter substrate-binding protein [Chlamydiia bacterium]
MKIDLKRFIFLPLFLVTLVMCSRGPKETVKLSLNIVSDPLTLDTRKMRILEDINIANMLYEGLFRGSEEGPVKALAESYVIDETETIYRFKIKKAHWSNGKAITANDFLAAYEAILTPEFPSNYAFLLYYIKGAEGIKKGHHEIKTLGVKALDDQTLEFQLNQPIPFFLDLLALPIYFPTPGSEVVFNGPFSLFNWYHNYQITLTKNPFYWDKEAVKIDRVDLFMCESETGMQMFEKGELDIEGSPFGTIPPDCFEHLVLAGKLNLQPVLSTSWIRVNTSRDDLQNKFFRKAIATAIHRKDLTEHIFFNIKTPTLKICPDSNAVSAYQDGSNETAREILASYPQSRIYTLTYKSNPTNDRLAQAIQAQLEEAGIQITLEKLESKVFFSKVASRDYDLAFGDWIADVPDAMNFLQNFRTHDTGTNNTNWENPHFKELLDKAIVLRGEQRSNILEEAESLLLEEAPIIPLFHGTMQYVKNPRLKGVHISNLGLIDIKGAYFSDE